jgi:hypothetical protein
MLIKPSQQRPVFAWAAVDRDRLTDFCGNVQYIGFAGLYMGWLRCSQPDISDGSTRFSQADTPTN